MDDASDEESSAPWHRGRLGLIVAVLLVGMTVGAVGSAVVLDRYGGRIKWRIERVFEADERPSADEHAADDDHDSFQAGERGHDGEFADPDDRVSRTGRPLETFPDPEPMPEGATGVVFAEDFTAPDSLSRFQYDIAHRDDSVVSMTEWPADHAPTGDGDECSGPDEFRTIERGEDDLFNDDWIYRCAPGGDVAKAHLMTSVGDTSGYSIGAFTPAMTFEGVTEVRWSNNVTDLGVRQFIEVKILPADVFEFQNLPCVPDFPCDTDDYDVLGGVAASLQQGQPRVATPDFPHGWRQDGNSGILCHLETDGHCFSDTFREHIDDPALLEVQTRRRHYLRDNGDGTITFGAELPDGTFHEVTGPGSFPEGPVRVVFADHSYTPNKDLGPLGARYTWHWDDIEIEVGEA